MKKILFGIFAIMLGATSAYCDGDLTVINTNGSYQSVLDSEIRVDAIRNVFQRNTIWSGDRIFHRVLKEIGRNGKITIGSFYDSCYRTAFRAGETKSRCQRLVEVIIKEHNKLVLESANGVVLTEEQFFNLLYNKEYCGTTILKVRPDSCENACKEFAIGHGYCKLFSYQYYNEASWLNQDLNGCWCNPGGEEVTPFEYTPTYEDYKRTKGIS